ncbi:MAG: LysM peptidoglycan-binding domain-containing protein [Clostridia bacterium]|nr:LysM peptidoglycan-binding domain-containing protein [Clostridia bacterium]
MTEAKYIGRTSAILNDDWMDNVPSYHSYMDFHKKRVAAKKQLKRERRIFFTICALLVCFCMSYFTIRPVSMETYDSCPSHCVVYGDTLWSIAQEYKGENCSTGEFVYKIKKANNMKTSEISAGDVLVIPVEGI